MQKETWFGWFASMIEAYNMSIYCFLAPFLAKKIFQDEQAVFLSYCLVFIGFGLFYPAGALYYGFLGDKKGRQKLCTSAALGLALATGLMGVIPFGLNAWILFFILICAQHFFSGGEYHGAALFSLEHAEEKQSGLTSSMSCLFAVFGLLLANGCTSFALTTQSEGVARGCFILGGIGGLLSYSLRKRMRETPAYLALSQELHESLFSFVTNNWRKIFGIVFVLGLFMVSYSFIFYFLPIILGTGQGLSTFYTLIAYGLLLVVAGFAADRFGVSKTMEIGAFLLLVSLIPLAYFCSHLLLLQIFLTALASFVIGPIHSWLLMQFEAHERCRGIFISSAIAMSLFGGSTVPICLKIYEKFHSLEICMLYPLMICLGAFMSIISSKEEVLATNHL